MTEARAWWRDATVAFAAAALTWAAGAIGSTGPTTVRLNLGPGDGPFVSGFAPEYEIDDRVATHWTTYDAAVAVPLRVRGELEVAYRFTRSFGETAVVDVAMSGHPIDHFTARGGAYLERRARVGALGDTPLALSVKVDSHERRNLGLKLDWIEWRVGPGGRVRLDGAARWRAPLAIVLVFVFLRVAAWPRAAASAFAAVAVLVAAGGLMVDPWRAYRVMGPAPLLVALGVLTVVTCRTGLGARWRQAAMHRLALIALVAVLVRGTALAHPDYYYPDLRTHARFALGLREAKHLAVLHPAQFTREHGIWHTVYDGRALVFPYPFLFHSLPALLPLDYDPLLSALKAMGAMLTLVPLVCAWSLARRIGTSGDLAALLMVLVPSYGTRLTLALLAALFGHAMDMLLLSWLFPRLERVSRPPIFLAAALLTAACQLAYVSGVLNTAAFLPSLAIALWLSGRRRGALAVAAFSAMGALLALGLYYRDFVADAFRLTRAGEGQAPRYEVEAVWRVLVMRTGAFFGMLYPALATIGLVLLFRGTPEGKDDTARPIRRVFLGAWLAAYLLLLVGRARLPDVFLHGHETLFATPMVCIASAAALAWLASRPRVGRPLTAALLAVLAVQGLWLQWRALERQLGNAL